MPRLEWLEDRALPSFNAALDYPVGFGPHAIGVGDFNRDGKPDLATASLFASPGNISVLMGNGDGTFSPAVNSNLGAAPEDVKAADFNGDGNLDLVTANYGNTISVLLGNGNGTFQAPVNYTAGTNPFRLALGDFNADGKLDLAVDDRGPFNGNGSVTMLLGNGDGTFATGASYSTGPEALGIAAGDFNGDGKLDLVATAAGTSQQGFSNAVYILLGNGNGTFLAPTHFTYATGASPAGVAVADFNGDGKADLAVGNYYTNAVTLLLGNGNGTFATPVNYSLGANGQSFYFPTVATADLNHDGALDLVVADTGRFSSNNIWVLLGNGNGTFQAGINYDAGAGPETVAIADLNADGNLDLATANLNGNSVTVLQGHGDGSFPVLPFVMAGSEPGSVAAADFNGDGKADLVTANYGSSNVSVLLSNGNGTFQSALNSATGTGPNWVAVGDFNGDGKPDLATGNYKGSSVSVLLGNGNGTFQVAVNYSVDGHAESVTVADVNGDGQADLLTANFATSTASVLLGNGNGTFKAAVNYTVGTNPTQVVAADFNGDSKQDLAVVSQKNNNVSLLLGNGNGTFGAATNVAIAGTTPFALVEGDFNGDGKPDLAVAAKGNSNNFSGAGVSIVLGNGNGTFQPAVLYAAGDGPTALAIGDFNGDGKPDLAAGNGQGADVSILLGNGDGTFQAPTDYVAGAFPLSLTVADFNGDNAPDLAAANDFNGGVSLLINQPAATHFQVSAPTSTVAGSSFNVTVTALSIFGGPAYGYTGTVHFSTTDPKGVLPADFTFTAADAGIHTFTTPILKTAGNQTITATDTITSSITGSAIVSVTPAALAKLYIQAKSGTLTAGVPFGAGVAALDAYNNVVTTYLGTVHFSASDPNATLPADYTFTAADQGIHIFTKMFIFQATGPQTITVHDQANNLTARAHITISPPLASLAGVLGGPEDSVPAWNGLSPAALDDFFTGQDPRPSRRRGR
jgi:hypothetical protein